MPISSGAQLGHGAVAKQVRPDGVAEGPLGPQLDLLVNRPAAHGAARASDPQLLLDIQRRGGRRCH
jgi:hypothetical protein